MSTKQQSNNTVEILIVDKDTSATFIVCKMQWYEYHTSTRKICYWEEIQRIIFPSESLHFAIELLWNGEISISRATDTDTQLEGVSQSQSISHTISNKIRALHALLSIPPLVCIRIYLCVSLVAFYIWNISTRDNCVNKCEQTRIFDGGWDNDILIKVIVFNLPN